MDIPCGIDLGTTYSSISYYDESIGRVETASLPHADGSEIIPSVVYYESAGNAVVGEAALNVREQYPDRVVVGIKRSMGLDYKTSPIDGQEYTPQQVSAEILKVLKEGAESNIGKSVKDVVISVPVYFGDRERLATQEAGKLAGLNVLELIAEPHADALAFAMEQNTVADISKSNILVYDLGGGTFDVALITAERGIDLMGLRITTLISEGDRRLGGSDWDKALAECVAEKAMYEFGIPDPRIDAKSYAWLLKTCEQAKRRLSQFTSVSILADIQGHAVTLTRQEFEHITARLLMPTEDLVRKVLEEAEQVYGLLSEKRIQDLEVQGTPREELESKKIHMLLCGGATYMPMVKDSVTRLMGEPPLTHKNPNLLVTIGAAYRAHLFKLQNHGFEFKTPVNQSEQNVVQVHESDTSSSTAIPTSKSQSKYTATQVIEMFQALRLPVTNNENWIAQKAYELRPQYQREKNHPDPHTRAKAERWYKSLTEVQQGRDELIEIVKKHFYRMADVVLEAQLQAMRRVVAIKLYKYLEELAFEECRFDSQLAREVVEVYFIDRSLSISQLTKDSATGQPFIDTNNPYVATYSVADVVRLFLDEINLKVTDNLAEIQARVNELTPKYNLMGRSQNSFEKERSAAWHQTVQLIQKDLHHLLEIVRSSFFQLADIALYDMLNTGNPALPWTFGLKLELQAREDFKCAPAFAKKLTHEYIQDRNIHLNQQPLSPDMAGQLTAFKNPNISYNSVRIRNFLNKKVDLNSFCLWLEQYISPFYTFASLKGLDIQEKTRSLLEKATNNNQLGDVICELAYYWLDDYEGRSQVLIEDEIHQELGILLCKSLDKEDYDKADKVINLLKRIMA